VKRAEVRFLFRYRQIFSYDTFFKMKMGSLVLRAFSEIEQDPASIDELMVLELLF
jgi:hypothetical protein